MYVIERREILNSYIVPCVTLPPWWTVFNYVMLWMSDFLDSDLNKQPFLLIGHGVHRCYRIGHWKRFAFSKGDLNFTHNVQLRFGFNGILLWVFFQSIALHYGYCSCFFYFNYLFSFLNGLILLNIDIFINVFQTGMILKDDKQWKKKLIYVY